MPTTRIIQPSCCSVGDLHLTALDFGPRGAKFNPVGLEAARRLVPERRRGPLTPGWTPWGPRQRTWARHVLATGRAEIASAAAGRTHGARGARGPGGRCPTVLQHAPDDAIGGSAEIATLQSRATCARRWRTLRI